MAFTLLEKTMNTRSMSEGFREFKEKWAQPVHYAWRNREASKIQESETKYTIIEIC